MPFSAGVTATVRKQIGQIASWVPSALNRWKYWTVRSNAIERAFRVQGILRLLLPTFCSILHTSAPKVVAGVNAAFNVYAWGYLQFSKVSTLRSNR